MTAEPWWHGGVIYQIYPSSFADGNGDGVGDLIGAAARLGHVADLGADAVWLGPIYPSGGVDGGYDVTDYLDVAPVHGGLAAFDRFVEEAHRLGLRVIMDYVPNHTSDGHPWFVESRSSRDNSKRDWYVWADGRDGGPPNNWMSAFTGSAWVWDVSTGQYYLSSFYPEQVDLNWRNPDVREAMTSQMRVWVERGVDGFRLDVVQRLGKDAALRDNPAQAGHSGTRYDENRPEVHDHIREIRRAVGPGVFLLGEVWLLDIDRVRPYVGPDELDLAFNFPFAMAPWNARAMATSIDQVELLWRDEAWPCYHLSNHDMPRIGTRLGRQAMPAAAVVLLTLRGAVQTFQGDEIGMVDGAVPPERRRDQVGRDGCRTPMQWDASPNAGFCPPGVEPWLPVAAGHETTNVAWANGDPGSLLHLYRRLLRLRRASPSIREGTYGLVAATRNVLVYLREAGHERLLVAVGFGVEDSDVPVPRGRIEVATDARREGGEVAGTVRLGRHEALVIRLARDADSPGGTNGEEYSKSESSGHPVRGRT